MSMQQTVEATLRQAVPMLLEMSGMGLEARRLRNLDACLSMDPQEWVTAVSNARDGAHGRLSESVREACFWAEALVWAVWADDSWMFEAALKRLESHIDAGFAEATPH